MLLPARHFLGWEAPLAQAVADWLLREPDRLPRTVVVVPTGHGARRLRQALARQAGGGVFSPKILTPDALFRPALTGSLAGDAVMRAAWHEALIHAPPEETEALRPEDATEFTPDRAWTSGWMDLILPAIEALADREIRPEEVPVRCPSAAGDARKWENIGDLERRVKRRLAGLGLQSPVSAKRSRALAADFADGHERVVLAGVPDPAPLARLALDRWMETSHVPVDVLIHAPADMEGLFDIWGLPELEGWKAASLPLPNGNDAIRIVRDDAELAQAAVRACAGHASNSITLACPDDSLLPSLERAFAAAGWPLFNPAGRSAAATGLLPALANWLDLHGARPSPYSAASAFLRSTAASDWLRARGVAIEPFRLATSLDLLAIDFLPESLDDALAATRQWKTKGDLPRRHRANMLNPSDLEVVFMMLAESVASVENRGLSAVTEHWIEALRTVGHDDGAGGKALEQLAEAVADLRMIESAFPQIPATDRAAIWRSTLPEVVRTDDDPGRVLDVLGWLELSYESGPHLVVAGMVDGKVPDAPRDDALLPDSVRKSLGLRDRESRATRDAFLWRSLVGCRESTGSVTVLVPKFDGRGEPRRPSSLLFRCLPAELPARVGHAFRELDNSRQPQPPKKRGNWFLDFTSVAEKSAVMDQGRGFSISPTRLRDYLECPFRYFLRHELGMEEVEANPRQWDARKFGTVLHDVLKRFGQDEEIRDSRDGKAIYAFLMESMDEWLEINHGDGLSLPLEVQVSSARERLRAFAFAQAAERAKGWEIRAAEWEVGRQGGPLWAIGGAPVSMTLDRVDFHPGLRVWRVLDYKTGKAEAVERAHIEPHADWKPTLGPLLDPAPRSKKPRRWKNLQLPLYAAFLRQSGESGPGVDPEHDIQTGYIVLSRAASEIGFSLWDGYVPALEESALAWAGEAVRRLRAGIFGPPALAPGKPPPEPWKRLAPDGWENALARPWPAAFSGEEVSA